MLTPQAKHNISTPLFSKTKGLTESDLASLSFGAHKFHFVDERPTSGFYFEFATDTCVLSLHRGGSKDSGLKVDFESDNAAYKMQKLSPKKDLLGRAMSISDNFRVCDLTMGLAHDSFKLAYFGGQVTGVERHPVVAALVKNGLERATTLESLKMFQIHFGDAKDFVKTHWGDFDAFYLDPMFSHKRTALPKKDMQYLADLVESTDDEDYRETIELLNSKGKRLVIKRARQDGPLCGIEPKHTLEGKMIRFDLYL